MKSKQSRAISATTAASAPAAGAASDAPALPPSDYPHLLTEIKGRIRTAQVKATLSANREMIRMYWDIGRIIAERQKKQGWGAAVIPRLARDIRNEMPEVKGFSERNIDRMIAFYREYPNLEREFSPTPLAKILVASTKTQIGPPPVAQLPASPLPGAISPTALAKLSAPNDVLEKGQRLVAQLPWAHNVLLMQKVKDLPTRCWYMLATRQEGWSHDVLALMIQSRAHERQGKAVSNFAERLPPAQSDLVQQVLKDPYIFDFLTLQEPFHEREIEVTLIQHLEKFLLELGQGFAFVGRQFHLDVDDEDFYVDLLFYHLKLRCFVVIDLKKGAFKPEYAGKMNFYCNVVDDRLRHETDQPTIGLILCQDRKKIVAEYALRGVRKPIGISEYQLTRALPKQFKSALPTIAQIEKELSASEDDDAKKRQ